MQRKNRLRGYGGQEGRFRRAIDDAQEEAPVRRDDDLFHGRQAARRVKGPSSATAASR